MVATYTISCIKKNNRPDPYSRITFVGGGGLSPWKLTVAEAIQLIDLGHATFFVNRPFLPPVQVVTAISRYGNRYLKTEADGEEPNNLLALPECP